MRLNTTNRRPVAVNDTVAATEDTPATAAAPGVLANDSDPDGNTITAVLFSQPAHGSVTLGDDGSFTYTPADDYAGPDSFTYKADDGTADSNTATVAVTVAAVNDAPECGGVSGSTSKDTAVDLGARVLGRGGRRFGYAIVSQPAHGTAAVVAGDLRNTPAGSYNETDSFTYRATDGAAVSNTATASVTVAAVNDAPTVTIAAGGAAATTIARRRST